MYLSRSNPKPTGAFLTDCSTESLFAFHLLWAGQTCHSLSQFPIPIDWILEEGTAQIFHLCPVPLMFQRKEKGKNGLRVNV